MKMRDYDMWCGDVVDVDLDAPPRERWDDAADIIGDRVVQILADMNEWLRESISDIDNVWFRTAATVLLHATPTLGFSAMKIANFFPQNYSLEIQGLARAVGVAPGLLFLGNLMYDLAQAQEAYSGRELIMGCSSFSATMARGGPFLARNLDWSVPRTLGQHTIVVRYWRRNEYYVSIGVAGLVGVLSAMRPGKWAITLNKAPATRENIHFGQFPATQHVRAACDSAFTYGSLVRKLQAYQTMSPFFAHVVGEKAEQQLIIEGFGESYESRTAKGRLVQTNHAVRERPECDFVGEHDGEVYYCERFKTIARCLVRRIHTKDKVLKLLHRDPVKNHCTMQSMVFFPRKGEYQLKVLA